MFCEFLVACLIRFSVLLVSSTSYATCTHNTCIRVSIAHGAACVGATVVAGYWVRSIVGICEWMRGLPSLSSTVRFTSPDFVDAAVLRKGAWSRPKRGRALTDFWL